MTAPPTLRAIPGRAARVGRLTSPALAATISLAVAWLLLIGLGLSPADAIALVPVMLTSHVLITVTAGAVLLGVVGGVLGSLAVLRGQSLLGDAVSHSALPGIYAMFVAWSLFGLAGVSIGGFTLPPARSLAVVLAGAALSGLAATVLIVAITRLTRLPMDTALALALASFFGLGLVFRSLLQTHSTLPRAGLEAFLVGSIATMTRSDLTTMAVLTGLALTAVSLFWKEFKLLIFDPEYLTTLGFPVRRLDALLTGLIVLAVVVGLQMVGVVLMSAMLIAPAVAGRQWTNRLGPMVAAATAFAVVAGLVGVVASTLTPGLSTGPIIVVYASGLALASVLLAPERGLVWAAWRLHRRRAHFRHDTLLLHLATPGVSGAASTPDEHARQLGWSPDAMRTALDSLISGGLLNAADGAARLTPAGRQQVAALLAELDGQTP